MIDELFFALLLVLVVVGATFIRPTRATCPAGSYVEGVGTGAYRPAGRTQCLSVEPDYDCSGANTCHGRAPRWRVPMQIYCSGGTAPIVVDERTVGCQRGGWR